MPEPSLPQTAHSCCLALVAGNTRLHWAWLTPQGVHTVWHTPHLTAAQAGGLYGRGFVPAAWKQVGVSVGSSATAIFKEGAIAPAAPIPLLLASVVPRQTVLWQTYPGLQEVRLADLPLRQTYATLGIDRALNLLGAGDRYGWPTLVVDAGTALTFTAGDGQQFLGGAILPGLATQFQALQQQTAQLPPVQPSPTLPERWAQTTVGAIQSGIQYSVMATVRDFAAAWQQQHPTTQMVVTGGDGDRLHAWLQASGPLPHCHHEPDLTFWGLWHHWQHSGLG